MAKDKLDLPPQVANLSRDDVSGAVRDELWQYPQGASPNDYPKIIQGVLRRLFLGYL